MLVACAWMESGNVSAQELATTANTEPVNATPLFSLVMMLANDSIVASCRSQFEKRTNLYLVEATSKGDSKNAKR